MNNMKRLSLALIALGLSAPAFASSNCCNSTVLVPSQRGGVKVGIDALYLRPTSSNLDYATVILPDVNGFSLGYERNHTIDPSYDWGVYAQIGYLFPCTGNDLTVGYTYLNSNNVNTVESRLVPVTEGDERESISVLPLSVVLPPLVLFFHSAEGKWESTLNVVDLEAGQRFTTGAYDMRMFAGLRYANIDTSLTTVARTPSERVPTFSGVQDFNSQFRGIGPRIGVDARYCLRSGFGLDANVSTSLLVGTADSDYNATLVLSAEPPRFFNFAARSGSDIRVVPVLEAKLGVDYTYIMNSCCKSTLVFEGGYQVTNYFNVSDHARSVQVAGDGDFTLFGNTTNNVAFDGPYLGVKYYA